jgi:hypothetical protein
VNLFDSTRSTEEFENLMPMISLETKKIRNINLQRHLKNIFRQQLRLSHNIDSVVVALSPHEDFSPGRDPWPINIAASPACLFKHIETHSSVRTDCSNLVLCTSNAPPCNIPSLRSYRSQRISPQPELSTTICHYEHQIYPFQY